MRWVGGQFGAQDQIKESEEAPAGSATNQPVSVSQ